MEVRSRIILDIGIRELYITYCVCEELNLRKESTGMVSIVTFGNGKGRTQTCQAVRIGVQTVNGGSDTIPALTITLLICGPLPTCPMAQSRLTEYKITLRDIGAVLSNDLLEQPETLIGMDSYWKFVTGQTLHHPNGPTASNTKFGWVFSGPM